MLPQKQKNQPSSQEIIIDSTQKLANLGERKSRLEQSIAMIIAQRGGNEAELVGTPFYDLRALELKKIEAEIAEINDNTIDNNEILINSTPTIEPKLTEISDTAIDDSEILIDSIPSFEPKLTTDDMFNIDQDTQDLFDSEEFAELMKILPGEYVLSEKNLPPVIK
jgi:hypothetical protein